MNVIDVIWSIAKCTMMQVVLSDLPGVGKSTLLANIIPVITERLGSEYDIYLNGRPIADEARGCVLLPTSHHKEIDFIRCRYDPTIRDRFMVTSSTIGMRLILDQLEVMHSPSTKPILDIRDIRGIDIEYMQMLSRPHDVYFIESTYNKVIDNDKVPVYSVLYDEGKTSLHTIRVDEYDNALDDLTKNVAQLMIANVRRSE